jgi:hypothetical protein
MPAARIPRVATLACALLLSLSLAAASAHAATWGNSGGASFTATTSQTLSISNASLTYLCTGGGTASGTINAGTTAATWTAFTGAPLSWGCPGATAYRFACTAGFTATSHSPASDPAPGGATAVTTGSLAASCTFTQTATGTVACTFSGTIAGTTYTNGTPASLAFPATSGLTAFDPGTGVRCPWGNGVPVTLSATAFTTTSATPPRLYHG